jgi:hypothetical protein
MEIDGDLGMRRSKRGKKTAAYRQVGKDSSDLRPGQYRLLSTKRIPAFNRDISKETRAFVLERNGYTCQMCGLAAGDPDPFVPTRTVRLTMGHIKDKSKGGTDTADNGSSHRCAAQQWEISESY